MISMLIGLKVSSLVLKCVFCGQELTGKLVPPPTVDGDSQTYSYKNVHQTDAADFLEGPKWGIPS